MLDLGAVLQRPGYGVREQFGAHIDTERQAPPESKFHNVKTNGYASAKEAKRAAELQLLERAGTIRNLREQVPFLLIPAAPGAERACYYLADFCFDELAGTDWRPVVLDVKGVRTKDYIIKRKLMLFVHDIRIREE